jgi:hypothetical protein
MDEASGSASGAASPRGFSVLDGAGLVGGAAAASVHLRDLADRPITAAGWALAWLAFSGVALSAAGPIVLAVRRLAGRAGGRVRLGDGLWLLLGLPWLIAAPLRPFPMAPDPAARPGGGSPQLYALALGLTLAAGTLAAMLLLWYAWVQVSPERRESRPRPSWSERVGLALAVAWPLQWGFLLVVLG